MPSVMKKILILALLGIFAGTSTGANIIAACKIAESLGAGKTVATLIVDSGLRYISTPLYKEI